MAHLGQFIINHWELWLAFLVILLLIFINERVAQKNKAKEISPQALVALINNDDATVFDLRDADNYKKGHIIGAQPATADDFSLPKMNAYKNKTIVLVCGNGQQSAALAGRLRSQEFTSPMVLAGGMTAWQNADLPLVKGK
ncbi:rhodanese-like domain-containing protein [Legionella sp. CNM-4043-24]|uniref:rhodanese-like domain-containing protein n=1 Tax=Legionella sp. CNM-4043-24 TaxID=3421646 RepID=UPI00403B14D8